MKALRSGKVYRRKDLVGVSKSADRCLKALVAEGKLQKLNRGVYFYPQETAFGLTSADEDQLLRTFLKTDRFAVLNPSAFNALGLGTTQLYNRRVVFNAKRHGEIELGGRPFMFYRRDTAKVPPAKFSPEVLVVELVNQLRNLAEDESKVLQTLQRKLKKFDQNHLDKAVRKYGTYSTRLKFAKMRNPEGMLSA